MNDREQQAAVDLAQASPLADDLGMQVGHVAYLLEQLASGADADAIAQEAALVLSSLRAAASERATMLVAWADVPRRLAMLGDVEDIDEDESDLSALTWPAARARIVPVLMALDRAEARVAEADRMAMRPSPGEP